MKGTVEARAAGTWRQMLPREHGAWGLLFQPFVAGAVLGGLPASQWLPAAIFLLAGFAIRGPLLLVARSLLVRRSAPPEVATAAAWLVAACAILAVSLWGLWPKLSPVWRAALLAGGPTFTLLATWVSVRNWQRSRLFQTASAMVLALSAPFAIQLARGAVPPWGWVLWLLLVLHAAAAIQLVHERLERRVASRDPARPQPDSKPFLAVVAGQITAGVLLAFVDPRWLLPPAFSSGFALAERRRMRRLEALREPLTRVGWRTLAASLTHLLVCGAAFWPAARGGG